MKITAEKTIFSFHEIPNWNIWRKFSRHLHTFSRHILSDTELNNHKRAHLTTSTFNCSTDFFLPLLSRYYLIISFKIDLVLTAIWWSSSHKRRVSTASTYSSLMAWSNASFTWIPSSKSSLISSMFSFSIAAIKADLSRGSTQLILSSSGLSRNSAINFLTVAQSPVLFQKNISIFFLRTHLNCFPRKYHRPTYHALPLAKTFSPSEWEWFLLHNQTRWQCCLLLGLRRYCLGYSQKYFEKPSNFPSTLFAFSRFLIEIIEGQGFCINFGLQLIFLRQEIILQSSG